MQSSVPVNGSPPKAGVQVRQKRVLPTRSRRGGPGVGSTDTDNMILETMRRRLESEPLIPAATKFLLTTNTALVSSTSDSASFEVEINSQAYGRYFDRPEVQRAYREQQIIQTPEFEQIDEDAIVGGRFRPRGAEDGSADTSDAAYEKRHRKYETFEKRQRLREKEKLKHEQYKLKERIDQLRAMDTSAFLALPASDFPEPPDASPEGPSEEAPALAEAPASHAYGTAAYIEGERRRKIMLDIALGLEERYRTLLPPDRRWLEKKISRQDRISMVTQSTTRSASSGEEEEEEIDELDASDDEQIRPVKERPRTASYHDEDGESEVDFEERERERSKGLKLKIKLTPRTSVQPQSSPPKHTVSKKKTQTTLSPYMNKSAAMSSAKPDVHVVQNITIVAASSGPVRVRGASGRFLPKHMHPSAEPASAPPGKQPPKKRPRTDGSASAAAGFKMSVGKNSKAGSSVPVPGQRQPSPAVPLHASHAGASGKTEQTTCVLRVAALRNSAAPNVRKTQRHVTAFGTRVPPEIEELRDFEIPEWVHAPISDDTSDGSDEIPCTRTPGMRLGTGLNGAYTGGKGPRHSVKSESMTPSDRDQLLDSDSQDVVRIETLE
ncbi:hypothetical protein WOLCODRAFT_113418 [Wolfiporia cocos MD-104 SS10]|uniref:PEHE domain-containing protein n=1 Tax=Wolfiporia cocos (strain MD-104) TaxID=742152 RepID=A0A2H3J9A1_WOLCO|nr:hypothetical protein WOLCODRAFT_113418 [Wolfiporia cocos MD-104 SS10]